MLARIEDAVAAIGRGEIVVVVDDEDRENEGDLIMAAEFATPEKIAFFLQHTSGVVCATLTSERARELTLTPMVQQNTESQRTAFLVTVDAPPRHHDRHLGGRPGGDDPGARRPGHATGRPAAAGPHLPARGARRRRAQAGRAHRGGRRPRPPRRLPAGRGDLRDRQRRPPRHGPPPRAGALLRRARSAAHLDRRPHPLPPPHGEARASRRHGGRCRRRGASSTSSCSSRSSTAAGTWRSCAVT